MKKRIMINLQLFAEGEGEGEGEGDKGAASTPDWTKLILDKDGKKEIDAAAWKILEPIVTSKVSEGISTWQKNNLSKYVSKDDYDKVMTESAKQVEALKIDNALIVEFKEVDYPELLLSQVKRENIKVTENGIIGIKEEVARLKAAYPKFYGDGGKGQEQKKTVGGAGATGDKGTQKTIEEQIADAEKAGDNLAIIRLQNKKYYSRD